MRSLVLELSESPTFLNNTFGETHCYAAAIGDGRNRHTAPKAFHVSPFFDVTGTYRFTLRSPETKLGVVVESLKDGTCLHMANITARRQPATGANLLKLALTNPLSTLGVTAGIVMTRQGTNMEAFTAGSNMMS